MHGEVAIDAPDFISSDRQHADYLWAKLRTTRIGVRGVQDEVMAICPLCDLELDWCEHGLGAAQKDRAASATLLISPRGTAHFAGCPHKGDDDDFTLWAEVDAPLAWLRLANGEKLRATGGARDDLVATSRCSDCVEHGPWS